MAYHNPPPSCLFCCNVRTGALLKSFLVLFTGFLIVTFMILERTGCLELPSDSEYSTNTYRQVIQYYSHSDKAFYLSLLTGFFYLIVGVLGVAGIVKNHAKYLLPVLVVQIFDTISTMGALISVLFMSSRYESFIDEVKQLSIDDDTKDWFMNMDPDLRFVTVVSYLTLVLVVRVLFAKCIYLTYKHITLEELAQLRRVREVSVVGLPDEEAAIEGPIYKLPRYEDLQKTPLVNNDDDDDYPTKPPAYEA